MTQPIRPMLGEIELQQAQLIQLDEDQVLTRHDIPTLEGDFFQQLGRAGAAVELTGIQSGPEARDGLTGLRDAFRAAQPLTFAADIVSATELDDVLIERFEISEHAGLPDCYEYRLLLREYTEAPEPEPETPPPEIEPPEVTEDEGVLVVNVVKEDDPGFDASGVTVTVSGTTQDGQEIRDRPLTDRDGNRWTEDPFPAGSFTVLANAPGATADGGDLSGTEPATVRAGETTEVTITLRDEAAIALRFIVHFRFDSAFVEPCLLQVLRQAAGFSADNADMRLLTVGHTDLAGTPEYNQSLSERRARSVFAVLRFANDPAAAVAEWNELRQTRTPGTTRSLRDTWGTREYQQMLQERGFYQGRIDGDHGPLTDTAVREFQDANGLPVTGAMNGATWPVLIEAYLAGENLSVADDRLLPNCPGEGLKWLGCGELDPVRNVTFAWRPNRRTELLFTRVTELPADVAQPDTFDLPSPGSVAGGWCLNDSNTTTRCCFVEPNPASVRHETCPGTLPRGEPLTRQPVEPAPQFVVQGSIRFEDGTPYTGEFFVTAPDGEYMPAEVPSTSGSVRAGTPVRARPEPDGSFSFPTDPATGNPRLKSPGIFILELDADVVARPAGAPLEDAKGPVVCKRLAAPADRFDVVIVSRQVAEFVPEIIAPDAVVVRRPHTNPARQPVVLRVNAPFTGTGTLTVSQGAGRVRIFDAPAAGNELTFNGTDNVFTSDQLVAGHTVFVEGGPDPSLAVDDVELALHLDVNGEPGFTDREQMTSVRLTLDIGRDRQLPVADPPMLSQTEKANPGRLLQLQNTSNDARRALVVVRRAEPADFPGDLSLASINGRVRLFGPGDEIPAPTQTPLNPPPDFANTTVPETAPARQEAGLRFFAEGAQPSLAARDAAIQLGLAGIEPDGDRVAVTVTQLGFVTNAAPFEAAVARAQIEGVLNAARASFGVGSLFGTQANSVFRLRAVLPGETAASVTADLISRAADRSIFETVSVQMNRQSAGVYVSNVPILAVPDAIARTSVTFAAPQSIEVIRARAEGQLSFELQAPRAEAGRATLPVRGRVVVLNVAILDTSGANEAEIRDHIRGINRVWSQCGLEFRLAGDTVTNITDPGGLDQIEALPANFFNNLGTERQTLFGLNPGAAGQIDVYIVDDIVGNNGEGFAPNDLNAPMAAFAGNIILRQGLVPTNSLGHEVGHVILNLPRTVNSGGDEHRLFTLSATGTFTSGATAPATNMMHGSGIAGREDLTADQCRRSEASGFVQNME